MKPTLRSYVLPLLIISGILMSSIKVQAQHLRFGNERKFHMEAGLNFGPTFFLGDLGGNRGRGSYFIKDVNLELTKMMKGAFFTVYPNSWLGFRVAGQYTFVSGRDNVINTDGRNELFRKERNLDFRSHMWEAYGACEFFPVSFANREYDEYDPLLMPYVFGGVGLFHFDPEGSLKNPNGELTWYKLHPLRTEGQGMKEYPNRPTYSLTQINIPFGGGVKVRISDRVSTGIELLYRHTFTDYIDDVSTTYIDPHYFDVYLSPADAIIARKIHDKTVGIINPGITRYEPGTQRGNPNKNDDYFSCLLKLGIKIGNSGRDNSALRQVRCPHFY